MELMPNISGKKRKNFISGKPIRQDTYIGAEGPVAAKRTAADYNQILGSVKPESITGLCSPEQDPIPL